MNALRYSAVLSAALLLPITTFAASVVLTPASISPKVGQTFTVTITTDPSGAKVYTTRANVSFDPAHVSLVSFAFAPKWVSLPPQDGYDSEDNAKGALVKTAGYPGGISSPTVLGTATFRAKGAGVSTIRVTTDSLILDAGGKNQLAGTQGSTQVTVAGAPSPTVTPTPVPTKKPGVAAPAPAPTEVVAEATTSEATSTATSTDESQVAAVAVADSSAVPWWAWALGALIVAIIGGAWWSRRSKRM
ncbi:MAG: cohesin domain-containing protein [bacterium]|nr:cohesin domain-containing protein [bacterium]